MLSPKHTGLVPVHFVLFEVVHSTHFPVVTLQAGVAPEQSESFVHLLVQTFKFSLQNGSAVGHSLLLLHPHSLLLKHTGFVPVHLA